MMAQPIFPRHGPDQDELGHVISAGVSFDLFRAPSHVIAGLVPVTGSGTAVSHLPLPMAGTGPAMTLREHEAPQ